MADNGGKVTIDGKISALTELGFGPGIPPTAGLLLTPTNKAGYLTYVNPLESQTEYISFIWIKSATAGSSGLDSAYAFRTLTDQATGITVSGYIHPNAVLTVRSSALHAEDACPACAAIRQRMGDSAFIALIDRDISLSPGFSGSLTVSIPVGAQYNGQTVTILHCANGTLQTYTATVQDGKVTFTATSLSPFAVFAGAGLAARLPKTGDAASLVGALALALAACCGAAIITRGKKRI